MPLWLGALVLLIRAGSVPENFACPAGAKDSGVHPLMVVRWCEESRDGRLLYNGPVWRWHRNGQLESKEYYVHGGAEGETPSWYENGKRSSLGTFKNGRKTGTWKYWAETGQRRTVVDYQETGASVAEYYPSGATKATGTFRTSGKIGSWVYWNENGTVKARCEFGTGLFALPDEGCRLIAAEFKPEGFSRPVPSARLTSGGQAVIQIGSDTTAFQVPRGWTADPGAGEHDDVPLAFYLKGGGWRKPGPNMYVRALFRDGRSFDVTCKEQLDAFEDDLANYQSDTRKASRRADGRQQLTLKISYQPVIATDSPFAITASNVIHERVGFFESSEHVIFMVVLACDTTTQLRKAEAAFQLTMQGARMASGDPPGVGSK